MIDENDLKKFIDQVKDLPGFDENDFDDLIGFVKGEKPLDIPQKFIEQDVEIIPQKIETKNIEIEEDIEIEIDFDEEFDDSYESEDEAEILDKKELIEEKKEDLDETNDIRAIIKDLKVAGKVKLAMFGNSTCRALLINDPLKLVQLAVLKNPRIQDSEIENFCKNPNTSQTVMRYIVDNKKWFKVSSIKLNLCKNPKCPPDISIKLLTFLHRSDVKDIARSKNLPSALSTAAKRLVSKHA